MPATEEGRYRVGHLYRPTPVPASPVHPLPGEGLFPHPSGLCPATFPEGEGFLRRERAFYLSQGKPSNTGLPV